MGQRIPVAPQETVPGVPTPDWKVEKQITLSDYQLSKTKEEQLKYAKREREVIRQRCFEGYVKPTIPEEYEADMACFILSTYFDRRDWTTKLEALQAKTVLSAFSIVDRDEEKLTISSFIRERNYCTTDMDLAQKILPTIQSEEYKEKINYTLSCTSDWSDAERTYYYQTPYEDFPTRRKFPKHMPI